MSTEEVEPTDTIPDREDIIPEPDKARSIIALNAGAGIYASGVCGSLREGVALADDVIASGQALDKLETFAAFSYGLKAAPL